MPHQRALDRFNVHHSPIRWIFSDARLELVVSELILAKNAFKKPLSTADRSRIIGLQEATRGLLVTVHVILNHGQVTWATPDLPSSPNYHTTPTGRIGQNVSTVHDCWEQWLRDGIASRPDSE
ncbi:hypothetical protein TNCV_5100161 [Trichonephila clavipes]|uniref:Uncharacterized protein n=1 Tax=Trichonephila clavipes TaxID=2585209 RepID=A0A8X6S0D6_TRICX|nr:hypothetical protein TNCV_5100161 [Trichonephila clavipes]